MSHLLLALSLFLAQPDIKASDAQLVEWLGMPKYTVRKACFEELARRFPGSLYAIRMGVSHPDVHVRHECWRLLHRHGSIIPTTRKTFPSIYHLDDPLVDFIAFDPYNRRRLWFHNTFWLPVAKQFVADHGYDVDEAKYAAQDFTRHVIVLGVPKSWMQWLIDNNIRPE